jgi:hypothetical protein
MSHQIITSHGTSIALTISTSAFFSAGFFSMDSFFSLVFFSRAFVSAAFFSPSRAFFSAFRPAFFSAKWDIL